MEEKYRTLFVLILLILSGYLSFLLLKPFMSYILLGLIVAFLFHPLYVSFAKDMRQGLAAALSVVIVLLIFIIPSIFLAVSLVGQANDAYQLAATNGISGSIVFEKLQAWTNFDITPYFNDAMNAMKDFAASAVPGLLSSTTSILLGLMLFFFVFYYALREGPAWYHSASDALPMRAHDKQALKGEIERMTKALFYGQVLTAVFVGIACGVIFKLFGIPNAIFWGFVMIIFSFLPVLGAPIVYIPAGIIMVIGGGWLAGVLLITSCVVAQLIIDYVVRPKIVGMHTALHPLIIILGALGGVYVFGFIGIVVGPLVLGIFLTLLKFDYGVSAKQTAVRKK